VRPPGGGVGGEPRRGASIFWGPEFHLWRSTKEPQHPLAVWGSSAGSVPAGWNHMQSESTLEWTKWLTLNFCLTNTRNLDDLRQWIPSLGTNDLLPCMDHPAGQLESGSESTTRLKSGIPEKMGSKGSKVGGNDCFPASCWGLVSSTLFLATPPCSERVSERASEEMKADLSSINQ
jgi:hypothetical protein